ncbi:MAG: hypothetical protein FDX21_10820 [Chlorobium sp.]|nr:MAG: hypothetical protein FDX21_10820 [Chlorobium sp.]
MGKANNPGNKSKAPVKVSILHLLLILLGADIILLCAPSIGILNSLLYIPDLYAWPASIVGLALLFLGFRDLYKQA